MRSLQIRGLFSIGSKFDFISNFEISPDLITRLHPQGRVARSAYFLDHQIQVIYSWTGQILVPKMIRWTFDKIVLWVKSELKVANVHCGKQLMYEHTNNNTWRTWKIWRPLHNRPFGQLLLIIMIICDCDMNTFPSQWFLLFGIYRKAFSNNAPMRLSSIRDARQNPEFFHLQYPVPVLLPLPA